MLRLSLALAAVSLIAAPAVAANPKQCRDAKGHFAPCPPVVTVKAVPGPGDVTKDKNGKCHWKAGPNKGKFVKCP
jgi:hypothetical protein